MERFDAVCSMGVDVLVLGKQQALVPRCIITVGGDGKVAIPRVVVVADGKKRPRERQTRKK